MKTLNGKRSGLLLLGILALGAGSVSLPVVGERMMTMAYAQDDEPNQVLIDTLFGVDTTDEAFTTALQQARETKLSPQLLLEAQLARGVFSRDIPGLLTLQQPLRDAGANLDFAKSRLFMNRDSYDSMVEGLSALAAQRQEDGAAFEKHIKQALWLGPEPFQMLYLQWLNSYRLEEAMKKVTVPFEQKLPTAEGTQTTLKELLGENKALLLDFWASWCAPCMVAMDEVNDKSTKLAAQGVVLVGINTEGKADIALDIKTHKQLKLPWLLEEMGGTYTTLLQTETLPRYVLVSAEGKVLFNGHPEDPALKEALKKIGVTL